MPSEAKQEPREASSDRQRMDAGGTLNPHDHVSINRQGFLMYSQGMENYEKNACSLSLIFPFPKQKSVL